MATRTDSNGSTSPMNQQQHGTSILAAENVSKTTTVPRSREQIRRSGLGPPSSYKAPMRDAPVTASGKLEQAFQFPPSPAQDVESDFENKLTAKPANGVQPTPVNHVLKPDITNHKQASATQPSKVMKRPAINRVMSQSTETTTARSSLDTNSLSDDSDETLFSDYASRPTGRLLARREIERGPSPLSKPPRENVSESLMMAYAQVSGSFIFDQSLVNQSPFDQVKRKAVVGGQGGGGVVGVDTSKRDSGLLGSFSWGSISSSLGGMLAGSEMSSIKEMKGVASSDNIPLLSTPKSILFVDLKLAPGESRSYRYVFKLPRGLPPSHKGRAMKVVYNFVIGTQRSSHGRSGKQQIQQNEVPFRVFSGVNVQGESLGHDLVSPYVILRDQARTSAIDGLQSPVLPPSSPAARRFSTNRHSSEEEEFQSHIARLISTPRRDSTAELLSPTSPDDLKWPHHVSEARNRSRSQSMSSVSTRLLIDQVIRLSARPLGARVSVSPLERLEGHEPAQNRPELGPASQTSQNQFTIARSGQPLAHLTLSRPAVRLEEVVHFLVNLQHPSCAQSTTLVYAIAITLESSEHIDPTIAIRSAASVERATRRVWDRRVVGGNGGIGLGWCSKWAGQLKVPITATPTFSTTGVSVEWILRLELIVDAMPKSQKMATSRDNSPSEPDDDAIDANDRISEEQLDDTNTKSRHDKNAQKATGSQTGAQRLRSLLHQLNADERGSTFVAVPHVACESFEVVIPIKVFGVAGAAGPHAGINGTDGLPV
ncbi:MAG: hypothetical protein M1828_005637 [Chrysothrix sp. TS-e1954]|nr:MAG: hypothetical protein M1828_005637 [Chrysothrix sp. TS-e1954]